MNREEFINAKRIVFKFGTNILRGDDGYVSLPRVFSFIEDLSHLARQGKEVIVITSGAVGLGKKRLGIDSTEGVALKQACAAIGQGKLMSIYETGFDTYGLIASQILLTEDDFSVRQRYLSLRTTLNKLLELKVIPIINQNDTVSTVEVHPQYEHMQVCFSDNDKLSALVASELDADLLVILSDVEGLYDKNPKTNPDAKIIRTVEEVTDDILSLGTDASEGGRGGMTTFLLWMLSELYDLLPEAGDPEKPKIVFFFDEAHLIFKDAPKSLLDKVEQIVRLIRSKGVGIYFITQQPSDIPDTVLSQLGNKLQHALRAYTPKDQKGLKAAAQAFRANPDLDAAKVLPELGTGEVLVSLLDADGVPTMVERAYVMPPRSYLGVADDTLRNQLIASSPLYSKYAEAVDRESAYEILSVKAQQDAEAAARAQEEAALQKELRSRSAAAKKEPPTVAEKLISKTMTRMENKAVDTIVRGIFNQMKKWF